MGECFYYVKARFPQLNKDKERELSEFFAELIKACSLEGPELNDQDKREIIKEDLPLAWEYVKGLPPGKLSGNLSFGNEYDIENLLFNENVMYYNAEVWHFADWTYLATFLESHFGATDTKWITDEESDIFLQMDAEENQEIISSLLSQKGILPTLIGIHPTLDQLIAENLKGDPT
jgi:hypothetical protein